MKRLILTVTNDLTYDQRMQRISSTLAEAGYAVTLVGRRLSHSRPLSSKSYAQKRLRCLINKGPLFYAEYNLRLFFFLLFRGFDAVCAADLDTVLPAFLVAGWKGAVKFYDAHELFTEMKEVRSRPAVHRAWLHIERFAVRRMDYGYTVGEEIAQIFEERYGRPFAVVRNMPRPKKSSPRSVAECKYVLYQGAVNEARGFEAIVPAWRDVPLPLVVCGDGNFMQQLRALIREWNVEEKIDLRGMLPPEELVAYTEGATIGINFTENVGLNQLYCLPNKYFDYVQAGIPLVTNDYPQYRRLNEQYEVALLVTELTPAAIAAAVNRLLSDATLYERLAQNALKAREHWHWDAESPILLDLYAKAFQRGR
ncbi:MAG: glycosyltransferase [Chitinophagaceae bacterium]|nr:MAG: glycosyltransferase [Chitinophagaceae bacterium]